jgi:hypothetical protein
LEEELVVSDPMYQILLGNQSKMNDDTLTITKLPFVPGASISNASLSDLVG